MTTTAHTLPGQRRHDLDALRAAAMLLGIAYHAALSFAAGFPWMVQDVSQTRGMYVFQAITHGFRMPMFFLLSGFFTAMMWRKRGLKALLHQRFRRILLPCLLGLVTIAPAMIWVSGIAIGSRTRQAASAPARPADSDLWAAVTAGDPAAMTRLLASGANPNAVDVQFGITPLTLAAIRGDTRAAEQLVDAGAGVNQRNRDGNAPLHAAAFLGRTAVVELLIARGVDAAVTNPAGETAINSAEADWPTTEFIASLFGIRLDRPQVEQGRAQVVTRLQALGVQRKAAASAGASTGGAMSALGAAIQWLINTPVFILVWFLWFLCWLVGGFAVYAVVAQRCGSKAPPRWLILAPAGLLVWVPLTIIPRWFMTPGMFGPDTYMGILPAPHVLFYYALFFAFGVLYYECDDQSGVLGRHWRIAMPLTLLIVFPIALEFCTGTLGFRDKLLPERFHHPASVALEALYAWLMTFACMGMFRSLLPRENRTLRYLSDSAYWLYLAHLPLIILAQTAIQGWRLPASVKCVLLTVAVTVFLLVIYDRLVRYTWLGTLLNGPRSRSGQPAAADAPGRGVRGPGVS